MPTTRASAPKSNRGQPASWLTAEERNELTSRNVLLALSILGVHFLLYFATLAGAVADVPVRVNVAFGLVNGLLIGLIFIVGHDCVHLAYVRGRSFNLWLGRLAFIPSAHSVSLWDVVHNKKHHRRTNLRGYDYVWTPLSKQEYDSLSPFGKFMERVYRGPFGPVVYYYPRFWFSRVVLPLGEDTRPEWRRHLPDSVFVILSLTATIGGILVLGKWLAPERPLWLTFTLGWVIPFAVWNYLMALSIYVQHTHPAIAWFDNEREWTFYNGNIRGSTHVELPVPIAPLWSVLMKHTAHHALPLIPIYRLGAAQKKLLETFGEDVIRYRLTLASYRDICRACKLYDYENHVWTDFQGRPTSDRTVPFADASARVVNQ